jgi:hypothetical protein
MKKEAKVDTATPRYYDGKPMFVQFKTEAFDRRHADGFRSAVEKGGRADRKAL